jgi:hypothetical protein
MRALGAVGRTGQDGEGAPVTFVNHGPDGDRGYVADLAAANRLNGRVKLEPLQPADAFRLLCRRSHVLLLVVGRDAGRESHAQALPGKLFDYLAARRPILVIGPPDGAAATIVAELRRGLCADDRDSAAIERSLRSLLDADFVRREIDLTAGAIERFGEAAVAQAFTEYCSRVGSRIGAQRSERRV